MCRLKKSLYNKFQDSDTRNVFFHGESGYKKSISDHCVFIKSFDENDFIISLLYVDDMLLLDKTMLELQI